MISTASRRWLTSTAVVLGVSLAILASATVVTAVLAARGEPVSAWRFLFRRACMPFTPRAALIAGAALL
ncbi:MAG: hypothetical protein J0I40_13780, partial [Cellulomonas sp.]|nr:hypothetical protein [Cellulomonas sp.]